MLFNKKAFTLTIGNESSLLVLHNKNTVENKVLVPSLSREDKIHILKIFKQNKSAPIYILLDNSEQSYSNKSYPSINRFDLKQIINRQIKQELGALEDGEDLVYNYMTHKNKKMRRWECMYVSSTYFKEMKEWIDFLLQEVNNTIVGIYMLPIESVELIKKLQISNNKNIKKKPKETSSRDKVTLLVIQNKVSGIRQVVFSNEKIIFTRLTHYDYESKNFISDFEQDIFRTNEYLKRILPNLKMEDVEIINVLPRSVIEKINQIKNNEITFVNYTPREIAEKIGYKNLIPKNSQFGDVLIANIFVNSKKVLKSVTSKIKSLSLLQTIAKTILSIALTVLFAVMSYAIFIQIEQAIKSKKIRKLDIDKGIAEKSLEKVGNQVTGDKSIKTDGTTLKIDEIIEFGRLSEAMESSKTNPVEFYKKAGFLARKNALISNIRYSNSYNLKSKRDDIDYSLTGRIYNEDGDVEKLFNIYDTIILETGKTFQDYKVISSELPKNIDFSKKYYDTSFTLKIRSKN
jgi:hypothetical protein